MTFRFAVRDPDVGYLGNHLWLPKRHISEGPVKAALEFEVRGGDGQPVTLRMWRDAPNHLAVPRYFFLQGQFEDLPFDIVTLTPPQFPKARFKSNVVLDFKDPTKDTQKQAAAAIVKHTNGTLNLSCGKGKTCVFLHSMAQIGENTLIIVNQGALMSQWLERIEEFIELDGQVGKIQGNPRTWDWKHPITIATLQTLSIYPDAVSQEMKRWFGVVVWDELHHLAAHLFSITATMFPGKRYGLTATVNREDGTHVIYDYHVGPIIYKDLMQTVKPEIYFVPLDHSIPPEDYMSAVLDTRGKHNIGKLRTYVAGMEERNLVLRDLLLELLIDEERKVLALSHSKEHLKNMLELMKAEGADCDLCTGDQKVKARWETLKHRQLILGTHQLVTEALDEKSLDTLVWMMPFGTPYHPEGGKNALQQGMGRIQGYRFSEGMKHPKVVICDDLYISLFHRMANQLRKQLKRWPSDEGGPYPFTDLDL